MKFSGRFLLSMMDFASMQGVPYNDLLVVSGLNVNALMQEDELIEGEIFNRTIQSAIDSDKDKLFGLHAGEYLTLTTNGLVGQITQAASTVKEAMELSCQFANLGCKAIEKKIVEGDEYTFIEYLPIKKWEESNQLVAQHVLEGMLAFAIREMRQLTKLPLNDLLVNLSYKPLDKLSEYNRVLNCPISFGAKTNSIRIPNEVMKAPIVSSNFDLLRVLVQHAELKLNELQKLDSWENRVNKMILYLSDIPSISIDQVAMLLGTSARTLQRKLKDEGLKFQFLLDQYKIGLCNYYLEKTDHAIKEIAYELGYNDSSAFIRFYKKHTGMSPSQVRV